MSRAAGSLPPSYFEDLYGRDPDPWRFATSGYERAKYAATLAALPRPRYSRALEVGCSIGVLTAQLAGRCDELLAVDVVEAALARARERCRDLPAVAFERMRLPGEMPPGRFDLILLSEVAYYWDRADVALAAERLRDALEPGGDLLLVHWTGETNYPLSADEAVGLFVDRLGSEAEPLAASRHEGYRLDLLRRRPPA